MASTVFNRLTSLRSTLMSPAKSLILYAAGTPNGMFPILLEKVDAERRAEDIS